MPRISFKGDIIDFHPTKNETVKITIETTLEEVERTKLNIAADMPAPEEVT